MNKTQQKKIIKMRNSLMQKISNRIKINIKKKMNNK